MEPQRFDFASDHPDSTAGDTTPSDAARRGRPFIGMMFDCCRVYWRIYRNAEGTAYAGACPKCQRRVRFTVGQGGSNSRFFRGQ